MKEQPLPADQLRTRGMKFDAHGRRTEAESHASAALKPTDNRDGRKRPADQADQDTRGRSHYQQSGTTIEYNPSLVKRQRRESPRPADDRDFSNSLSSADLSAGQSTRSGHGNGGRHGGEREWRSPTRTAYRGGRGGGVGRTDAGSRYQLPPAPRDQGRNRDSRPERNGYQGLQHHPPQREQSNKTDQTWQFSNSNPPPPPRVNSFASAATGPSSSAPRIDPQKLPLPPLPNRPSHGPSGSAAAPLPPKPTETTAPPIVSRPVRSTSASSASYTILSDSDDDDVGHSATRVTNRSSSSLFNGDDDDNSTPRVELQYNHTRLSASSAATRTQFNRRASPASGSAVAPPPAPPTRSWGSASSEAPPPPTSARTRAPSSSSTAGAAASRGALSIAFPEINYSAYPAASDAGSATAPRTRRASIDEDNDPDAQRMAAMSAQHQRYLDLVAKLDELDDQSSDLDKQISALLAARKEVDAKRTDLLQRLRTALDDDPITTAATAEEPALQSAAGTPPVIPRQAAAASSSSASRPGPPSTRIGSASSGASTAPSPLTVARTAMAEKITTRKPRALAFHPQSESDLVAAAFMDGGVRFFDTSRRSCTLLNYCPIASTDPANPGKPDSSPRIDAMRFVGDKHLVSVHLKKNEDGPQMSMITVDRQPNGNRALSTKHHLLGISLYDRETSAIASDRDPATYRFATAGKRESDGWRVHLWSLRQPVEVPDDDGKYPHVLRPKDHFTVHPMPATHTSLIHSMILNDNNLLTSGYDGRLHWIDVTVQQPKWKTQLKGKKVTQILSSPTDPHLLYVACADSSAQFRAIDLRLVGSNAEPVPQVQFGFDLGDNNLSSTLVSAVDPHTGMHFVCGSPLSDQKGTVLSWDMRFISNRSKVTYYEPTQEMQLGHSGRVEVVQFSPHSHSMATLGVDYRLGLHTLT
ncbi:hypothetical protein BCR44DRAFT_53281 [Catenaria anguillulae PL171]|uniref:WD40-repeat-containing domain protein n=1 Tax=Catenaria anguillulae PL171 TaxID=765915 RepID=A0A1Y2I200_9FUNG|nr:hypothetical protein BCR44DRAFT_53281 [Catenaria anguillulae PL171]